MSPSQSPGRRRPSAAALAALLSLSLAACGGDETATPQQDAPAPRQDAPPAAAPAPTTPSQPPSPSSLLSLIYQKDGGGALSYDIGDGAIATWWFDHAFDLGDRHWYAGFAYNTPARYGPREDNPVPAPGTKVNITVATLFKDSAGSDKAWTLDGAYPTIGESGAYERAGAIDRTRRIESRATGDGRMVLVVPVTFFANGIVTAAYEVFLFDTANLDLSVNIDRKRWTYIGNVLSGEDNEADCGDGPGERACYESKGTLGFGAADESGLPTIRIAMRGTGAGGEAVDDVVEYRYDTGSRQYLPAP